MSTQQFSLADISSALSRIFALPPNHAGLAKLSGMLQKTVNEKPEFQKTGLQGGGFQSLAMSNLPADLMALLDPAKQEQIQREQAEKTNMYSADGIAARNALETALGRRGQTADAGITKNSSRYDGIVESTGNVNRYDTDAGKAEMRAYAIEQGVPWVGSVPEILRLGPAAVKAFADVQLRQESYNRLVKDAGFEAKDVVTLAKFAKEKGVDANELSGVVADSVKALTGNDRRQREELDKAITGFMAKPQDEASKKHLNEILEHHATDPEKKKHIEKLREKLQIQQGTEHGAQVDRKRAQLDATAARDQVAAAQDKAKAADAGTDAILSGAPDPKGEPGKSTAPDKPAEPKKAEAARPANQPKIKTASAQPAPGK
jgi:hypothetical protein